MLKDLRGVEIEKGDLVAACRSSRVHLGRVTDLGKIATVDFGDEDVQQFLPHVLIVLPSHYDEY